MSDLMRKQYLVTESNVAKLENISVIEQVSAAEIVRRAIDAYTPNAVNDVQAPELMEFASMHLKEAVKATKKANRVVAKTLKTLTKRRT